MGHKAVSVRAGACRLTDGTVTPAHALLDSGVRALVQELGRLLQDARALAAAVPAKALGVFAGRLAARPMTHIVVLNRR